MIGTDPTGKNFTEFTFRVALGQVYGHSVLRKLAARFDLTSGQDEVIWNYEAVNDYNWSTTADIQYISSSNDADNQTLLISGLDNDWNPHQILVTLDGHTPVQFSPVLLRINDLENLPITGPTTTLAGNVYVYTDNINVTAGVPDDPTDVKAYVAIGHNRSLMSQYSLPAGYVGLFYGYVAAAANKQAAATVITTYGRPYGGAPIVTDISSINTTGNSVYSPPFNIPFPFPEKTDLWITANSSANGVAISGSFELMLVAENLAAAPQY